MMDTIIELSEDAQNSLSNQLTKYCELPPILEKLRVEEWYGNGYEPCFHWGVFKVWYLDEGEAAHYELVKMDIYTNCVENVRIHN